MSKEPTARRLLVQGRVQGVFYRNWTVATARGLGLSGWVRNRAGGEVEILAVGSATALDALADACGNGPPAACVQAVIVSDAEVEPVAGFTKRPTA
jgi:acylphosphatase